ncbi:MAG: FKBP-type peptidylprolyl isomerase [Flavobacterium sp.]|nr:FKBP-type peptidylprolyl isomerase [Flavobacterium sp.]
MNKFKFYFILFFISVSLFSCKHDDSTSTAPPRDRAVQYTADIDSIEEYLKSHSLTKVEVDGLTDVVITDLVSGGVSIWDNTEYPLQFKMVKNDVRVSNLTDGPSEDVVDYKLYYVVLNEGGGARPTTTDSTFVSYRGWKLDNDEFDKNNTPFWATFPAVTTSEISLISGFRQFTPVLKAASSVVPNSDGTFNFINAGVGVVFIPSGLGYYNVSRTGIPAYSPLVFTIRLNGVRERDHDLDGVLTKYEELNANGNPYDDDTDGDLIPDFLDTDDDGDDFLTKFEITKTGADIGQGPSKTYPYDAFEDPNVPANSEPKGIPSCNGDFTSATRLRKHLDPSCH